MDRKTGQHRKHHASAVQFGHSTVKKLGLPRFDWADPYHLLLTMPWPQFLALICIAYLFANVLFALAYVAGGDIIVHARPGSFADAFFFSTQTMATIGYGIMAPRTTYAHILTVIESLTGLLGLAIATGLMFARFSRPTARIIFSRAVVIRPFDGVPTLMFRIANQRHNRILEAQVRVNLLQDEQTVEGDTIRRFHELALVRSQTPVLALTWTVMHKIDAGSILSSATLEDLKKVEAEILVTLTGLDETFSQTVHARHSYLSHDIHWNKRFVDIIGPPVNGVRHIDYTRFHDVDPMT